MIIRYTGALRSSIALIGVVMCFFLPVRAYSENLMRTTIAVSMGTGRIMNEDDAANARERAIAESLVSGIEQVLSDLLPVESVVANFNTLNTILYTKKDGLIQDYKVLAEEKYDAYYRVVVQSTVSVTKVQQQLALAGIVVDQTTMPGILFLISEQNLEDIAVQYWWGDYPINTLTTVERAVSEALQKKGFSVIDHQVVVNISQDRDTFSVYGPVLDHQAAIELGMKYQADVVITGSAQALRASNTMGDDIKSFLGKLSLQVFRTDTGTEIASLDKTAMAADADDISGSRAALSKAGTLAGEDLAPLILSAWRKEDKKPREIQIDVGGKEFLSHFVVFRTGMKKITGMKGMRIKEMGADHASIVVYYQGDGTELANTLILSTFDAFGLNIKGVSENNIDVEIIPASR